MHLSFNTIALLAASAFAVSSSVRAGDGDVLAPADAVNEAAASTIAATGGLGSAAPYSDNNMTPCGPNPFRCKPEAVPLPKVLPDCLTVAVAGDDSDKWNKYERKILQNDNKITYLRAKLEKARARMTLNNYHHCLRKKDGECRGENGCNADYSDDEDYNDSDKYDNKDYDKKDYDKYDNKDYDKRGSGHGPRERRHHGHHGHHGHHEHHNRRHRHHRRHHEHSACDDITTIEVQLGKVLEDQKFWHQAAIEYIKSKKQTGIEVVTTSPAAYSN